MRSSFTSLFLFATLAIALPICSMACGGGSDPPAGAAGDGGTDRRLKEPQRPQASCPVVIESPEVVNGQRHVPEGTALTYNSNPPSSGQHYPVWANFKEYSAPLEEGYLVHSLEHGAIALLYKCDPTNAACAPTIEALRSVRDSLATDPACSSDIRVRVILAPSPKLDVPVAAAAWGFTYKADCLDIPTITQFAKDNYAKGPEDICAAGRTF